MPSLMEMAREHALRGQASAATGPATAPAPTGPALQRLPAGSTGAGLDAFAAKRQAAVAELQTARANQRQLLQQLGENGYLRALQELQAKAEAADTQYRQAAAQQGYGMFVE